jgi:two-component system chemotaxis response regulator CheY
MSYAILVVDDSKIVRSVIQKAIAQSGLEVACVYEAGDGLEALEVLAKNWVDVVFADINMPNMDGIETLKAIRKALQTAGRSEIPEVIMSAYEDRQAHIESERLGIKRFVEKPFELDAFLRIIEHHVKR